MQDASAAKRIDVSVIVPCHNERENLTPLVQAITAALEPLHTAYEIVIVDDRSEDGTWADLLGLSSSNDSLRALRFQSNSGQSAALWAGMQAARGAVLVTMDADLQNDPRDIPKLLEALQGADCACGSRVASRHQGDHFMKIASSRIANWVRNKLSDETIADAGCCYRAFRRECIANVRAFRGFHRFLPTLIRMEGFRVTEVAVNHNPRRAGQSHYGLWNRLFASFADLLAVRWMKNRRIRYEIVEKAN